MQFTSLYIHSDNNHKRVDALCKAMTSLSYTTIMTCIRKKRIRINGKACKIGDIVYTGDTIDFTNSLCTFLHTSIMPQTIQQKTSHDISRMPSHRTTKALHIKDMKKHIHNTILYHNRDFICLNKMKEDAVFGKNSIAQQLQTLYRQTFKQTPSSLFGFTAAPCHRLDRNTSGILVCAWSINAAREMQLLQSNKYISKLYFGIVSVPHTMHKTIKDTQLHANHINSVIHQHALYRYNNTTTAVPCAYQHTYAQNPRYTYLGTVSLKISFLFSLLAPSRKDNTQNIWCVAIQPLGTGGKTHQIRAQCKQIHIPLWGDTKYTYTRNKKISATQQRKQTPQHYFLHAAVLLNKYALMKNTNTNDIPTQLQSKKISHFSLPRMLHAPFPPSWNELFCSKQNTSNFLDIETTIQKMKETYRSLTINSLVSSNNALSDTEDDKIDLIDCFNSIFGRVRG